MRYSIVWFGSIGLFLFFESLIIRIADGLKTDFSLKFEIYSLFRSSATDFLKTLTNSSDSKGLFSFNGILYFSCCQKFHEFLTHRKIKNFRMFYSAFSHFLVSNYVYIIAFPNS